MQRSTLPTVRQLEILLALARTQNFSRAAQAVGISQSALSQAVAQTEFLLNVQLVKRTRRSVLLTRAGQSFAQRAEAIIADLAMATTEAQAETGKAAGRGRVG